MKKFTFFMFIFIIAISLVISGCGKNPTYRKKPQSGPRPVVKEHPKKKPTEPKEVVSEVIKPVEPETLPDKPKLPPTPEPEEVIPTPPPPPEPTPVEPAKEPIVLGGTMLEDFEDISDWSVRVYPEDTVLASINQSSTILKRGSFSGQLSYDFTAVPVGSGAAAYMKTDKMIPLGIDELSVWVYGNGSGHWLRARFIDAKGIKFVADLTRDINWYNEWKLLTIRMSDIIGFEDGKEDIPYQLPLKLEYIYIYAAPKTKHDVGNIYFDDFFVK